MLHLSSFMLAGRYPHNVPPKDNFGAIALTQYTPQDSNTILNDCA